MKLIRFAVGIVSVMSILSLCACSDENVSEINSTPSELQSSSVITGDDANSESDALSDAEEHQGIIINVETQKYENEQLSFEYNNENYLLPLQGDRFVDDYYWRGLKLTSEQIINNRLGEKITAVLNISEDMSEIYSCDVINQNGQIFYAGMLDASSEDIKRLNEDPNAEKLYQYTLTQVDGTIYQLSNINRTLTVDLNDLNTYEKLQYPAVVEDVSFKGYLFKDGQFIIQDLFFCTGYDENGYKGYNQRDTNNFPHFFATVQSIEDYSADILLNDKKTHVTVPLYYCESKLSIGQEVMVTLNCDTEIFGSGKDQDFDYAVIHTDPKLFNYDNIDFDTLAYAMAQENELGSYYYTTIDEAIK